MHALSDSAHGARPAPAVCASFPILLGWTDPETGAELGLAMHGSGEFLSQLLAHGFSDLASEPSPASVDGAGAGESDG